MSNTYFGYIRVSSRDQNEARQIIALTEFGIQPQNLFIEKQTGKDFNRGQYKKMLRKLKPKDVIVVKSIDRFGRNYEEILEQWRVITKTKKADIVVLDMPLLDTRSYRDLTGTLISDIVLQLFSYVAQTEREFIHQRQAEGIAAAKERGVRFGRKKLEKPNNYKIIAEKYKQGVLSSREAGDAGRFTYDFSGMDFRGENGSEVIIYNYIQKRCK